MPNPNVKFFLVWTPEPTHQTGITFRDRESAQEHANELAKKYPGNRFYVLHGTSYAEVPIEPRTVELPDPPDPEDIPF